jgi:hypothetical protein
MILLMLPAAAFFAAFFILPMYRLFLAGASGATGWRAYAAILTDTAYFHALLSTLGVAAATTLVTLILGGVVGVFLQRNAFRGRAILTALITLPLAFPGVVIGFMVIMLAGRQGLLAQLSMALGGPRLVFAYSLGGLFLGYVYFSLPRTILTVMAAAEKLDPRIEEAARAWRITLAGGTRRDPARPQTRTHLRRCNLLCHRRRRLRHGIHAGHPDQRAADGDLHRIHALSQHRDGRRPELRAGSDHLGGAGAGTQRSRRHDCRRSMRPMP